MFVTERNTGLKHVVVSAGSQDAALATFERRVIRDRSGVLWNSGAPSLDTSRVAWRYDHEEN